MRLFILSATFLVLFLLNSCIGADGGKKVYSRYEIVNDTDHHIVLESYSGRLNNSLQKTIQIESRDYWQSERFTISEPDGDFLYISEILKGDSIRVEFDTERLIIYKIEIFTSESESPRGKNLLDLDSFERHFQDKQNEIMRFTFTEADYENAEEI